MNNSIGYTWNKSILTGCLTILACLISLVFASTSLAQEPKNSRKTVFTGVVSDTINGMLIDSVSVSAGGITTRSNAQGVFTLEIPAKQISSTQQLRADVFQEELQHPETYRFGRQRDTN